MELMNIWRAQLTYEDTLLIYLMVLRDFKVNPLLDYYHGKVGFKMNK